MSYDGNLVGFPSTEQHLQVRRESLHNQYPPQNNHEFMYNVKKSFAALEEEVQNKMGTAFTVEVKYSSGTPLTPSKAKSDRNRRLR